MKSATAGNILSSTIKLLLLSVAIPLHAAAPPPPPSHELDALATPQYKGEHTIPLAKDDPYPPRFTLIVSWIPGDDNAGYFRYMVTGAPTDPYETRPKDPGTPDWEPREAIKHMETCAYVLRIFAPGGHLLASIPLHFKGDLNWTNEYTTITDNYLTAMPLAAYREFLKAPAPTNWTIIPTCK